MSGPATAMYEVAIGDAILGSAGLSAVMLAAHAIREAQAIHEEYGVAYARLREREQERLKQRHEFSQAKRLRLADLHRRAERLQARLSGLQGMLAEQLGDSAPVAETVAAPAVRDERTLAEYLARLEDAVRKAEAQLPSGPDAAAMAALLAEQPEPSRILSAYAQRYALRARLSAEEFAHYRELSAHLLSRLERDEGETLPVRVEQLAREMLQAHDAARAEALASELRREIQQANQRRKQQQADAEEAALLLEKLPDDIPDELRAALEQCAAGAALLDVEMRVSARTLLEELGALQKREEQEAMSLVLEQSLRDLGYEVDDIAATLFVAGGVVHFQKQAWDNYHVRMRVNPAEKTANFNVVRARGSGDVAADKRLDYMAEDRWCSEFPALLKTMEARGIRLNVTRLLQAGELPVQVVDAATLPAGRAGEERRRTAPAKQMTLDGKR